MAAVNKPTDPKQKEKDINQKLQLYGIYSAFANGKVPSNKQVDVALNSALASKPLGKPSPKLSDEGKVLVADLRDVIEKAQFLLLSKNEGDVLQDFIWQCRGISGGDATKPGAPVDKDTAKQHGNEALDGLRTLGTLILSNGQFRKLLNDALVLLRDIAGDGAQKAATKVNPSEEQLNQIDEPAEDNTWHDVPDLSVSNIKSQARDQYQKNKPFNRDDLKNAANQAQNDDPANAAAGLRDQADAAVPEETKQRGREATEKSKAYLKEKLPKERREQTVLRLKKMVVEIQGHSDYQQAIDTLLRLAETYGGHGSSIAKDSKGSLQGAHTDTNLKTAEADLKLLIERSANGTSTDDLMDSINQIYKDANEDPELKGWFKHLDTYIRKCLKEQGFVMRDEATEEWNKLYDQGNFLLRERYRNHTNRVIDEVKFLADQFDQDPQNKAFSASLNKLFRDLGNDQDGKPTFKPHLLKDLSEVIVPGFFENVRYIPVPRIEYSDPMADAVIENLVIEGDNLAPNVFEFSTDNYFRWGRKQISSKNKNKIMVSVSGIQMDLRDVSYYVKKKQGFPSLTDKGVMDIFLGGTGFSFKLALETADPSDKNHFFKVNNVTVDIKHMNIKVKQSNHKMLFNIFKPLLFKVMKPVLQKVLQKQIKDNVHKLDAFCFDVHQEAKRAAEQAKANPEEAQNIYQRYVTAYQKKVAQGKEKVEEKAADKQTNVAMTQHDSIFKNIELPGGISTTATKYKELAASGEKWESPVFSIGSASGSSNLPKAPTVTRKPHNTTPAVLKDRGEASNVRSAADVAADIRPANGNVANGSALNTTAKPFDQGFTAHDDGKTTLGANNPVLTGSA